MKFKVRDNETREWCEGDFYLQNDGRLICISSDMVSHNRVITDTHTAQFPVGEQADGIEVYEGDEISIISLTGKDVFVASMKGLNGRGCEPFYQWVDFDEVIEIIPPTPKPKVLTWPELESTTCFTIDSEINGNVYRKLDTTFCLWNDGGVSNEFGKKAPVTIVEATFTEVE